jgi:triphosphoribosyl-dephospho-CoA synthase
LLGTVILLMPLAVAAGMTPSKKAGYFEIPKLRENIKLIVESTTADDAVQFYEAIRIANPGGLNKAPDLDVNDPDSVNKIVAENISLYQVFRIAADYDNVCSEWVKNYPITFDLAYPHLKAQIIKTKNLNTAIVHTFLKVLSEYPDTFIARKVGFEKARAVSSEARKILNQGEIETLQGKESIRRFDNELRKSGNLLNPGTTADIIAAALALNILDGYKP